MFLNKDIVDIEKPDGICLLIFVTEEFSGSINFCYYTLKICINNE